MNLKLVSKHCYDKMILITRIGSLIYSVPEGYAHDKCKQGVSVPYYALVHFYHQS